MRRSILASALAAAVALGAVTAAPAVAESSNNSGSSSTTSTTAAPAANGGSSDSQASGSSNDSSSNNGSSNSGTASTTTPAAGATTTAPKKVDGVVLSPECQAEVDAAVAEHKQAAANGGSSFVGPQELIDGMSSGYGSSGMPDNPECVKTEKEKKIQADWDKMPEWVQSARPNETADEVFSWIGVIMATLAGLMQVAVMAAKFNPALLDPVRDALRAANIKF